MDKKNVCKLYDFGGDTSKRWSIEYYDAAGKRHIVSGGINRIKGENERRAAAAQYMTQLMGASDAPALAVPSWFQSLEKKLQFRCLGAKKKTIQSYQAKINQFRKYIDAGKFSTFTANDAQAYMLYLHEKGLNPSTINDYNDLLKSAFDGVITPNPFSDMKKLKERKQPAKYFNPTQRRELLAHFKTTNTDVWMYIQIMYYTFIRPGEIRLLRVEDVLIHERKIRISAAISKNAKLQYVAIPSVFLPTLLEYIEGKNPNDYLFQSVMYKGAPQAITYICRAHQNALKELGYDTGAYKLYSWKHTGAVAAVQAGINIKQLQIQLRHHSLDQVNEYLRQLGINDLDGLEKDFPEI